MRWRNENFAFCQRQIWRQKTGSSTIIRRVKSRVKNTRWRNTPSKKGIFENPDVSWRFPAIAFVVCRRLFIGRVCVLISILYALKMDRFDDSDFKFKKIVSLHFFSSCKWNLLVINFLLIYQFIFEHKNWWLKFWIMVK